MERCIAATTIGKSVNKRNREPKTFRCEKEAGHEGAHEYKSDSHTVIWYGEARKTEDDTRYRYGFRPGWQTF